MHKFYGWLNLNYGDLLFSSSKKPQEYPYQISWSEDNHYFEVQVNIEECLIEVWPQYWGHGNNKHEENTCMGTFSEIWGRFFLTALLSSQDYTNTEHFKIMGTIRIYYKYSSFYKNVNL